MHQVRHPVDRLGVHADRLQAIDELPVDLGGWRIDDRAGMILVEHQPHRYSALHGGVERGQQRGGRGFLEPQVVEGDVEALLRAAEEGRHTL
jgi:hypothetical protein